MTQTNKFVIEKYINENRANIIAKYAEGMLISDIAKLYGVAKSTIYIKLIKWGIKIKKCSGASRRRNEKPVAYPKRKFSPELLVKMKKNSLINDKHIKHCELEGVTEDQRLVTNIICRPII